MLSDTMTAKIDGDANLSAELHLSFDQGQSKGLLVDFFDETGTKFAVNRNRRANDAGG